MITGQLPRKTGHSSSGRAYVLASVMAVFMACIAAGLLVISGHAKTIIAAAAVTQAIAQDAVVPPVKRQKPSDAAPATTPEAKPAPQIAPAQPAQPTPAADTETQTQPNGGIFSTIQDWLARANREYQGIVVKELSLPPAGSPSSTPGDDPIAKKLDEQQRDDAAKAAAEKRDAEAKRLADDRRRAEETKRLADEASRKADEILKDVTPQPAETAEQQQREAQKVAEENRRQEEQRQAEAQRRADAERKRLAAAEAARAEAARADAASQEAERRRADEAAANQMHRRRTFQLTTEPIERPEPVERPAARDMRDVRYASYRPMIVERPYAGTAVKRWVRRMEPRAHTCRAAGRRVALPGRYTVRSGDSLWRISKKHYRKGKLYKRIYAANRGRIRNPNLIYPCQRVFVPRKRR